MTVLATLCALLYARAGCLSWGIWRKMAGKMAGKMGESSLGTNAATFSNPSCLLVREAVCSVAKREGEGIAGLRRAFASKPEGKNAARSWRYGFETVLLARERVCSAAKREGERVAGLRQNSATTPAGKTAASSKRYGFETVSVQVPATLLCPQHARRCPQAVCFLSALYPLVSTYYCVICHHGYACDSANSRYSKRFEGKFRPLSAQLLHPFPFCPLIIRAH